MGSFLARTFILNALVSLKDAAVLIWFKRILWTTLEFLTAGVVVDAITIVFNTIKAGSILLWFGKRPDLLKSAVQTVADEVTAFTPVAAELAANTIEQITGISIDKTKLTTAAKGVDRLGYQITMGEEFTQVVSNMLNVKSAISDFQTRTGTAGSFTNLAAYFGTNLDFQLRSLTIGTIATISGFEPLRHLEGLHQSINWAFGFGWLSWSVLSNAMDVTVNAGLKRYYLSIVKPHDLTLSQANKMHIRGRVSTEVWQQIVANTGLRDDAREWALELEFNQPSFSVLQKAWDHRLITEPQLDEQMIIHELTPAGAEYQKQEIMNERKWGLEKNALGDMLRRYQHSWTDKNEADGYMNSLGYTATEKALAFEANRPERIYHLREAVTREHFKFLRHGWENEQATIDWLHSQHWTEEEIALALEANRLDIKAEKFKQKPHLTLSTVAALVANGTWAPLKGQQYLIDLKYEPDDANSVLGYAILQHMVSITPKKVRDACEQENHLANLLTSGLTALQVIDPMQIIANNDFRALVQCWINSLMPTPGTPPPPQPVRPPVPTALRYGPLPTGIKLDWDAIPLLADYVVYRRSIGDATPIGVGFPGTLTTYTDTGLQKGQVYLYTVRAKINGIESKDSNEVQVLVP